jgi:hypothetical protein
MIKSARRNMQSIIGSASMGGVTKGYPSSSRNALLEKGWQLLSGNSPLEEIWSKKQ